MFDRRHFTLMTSAMLTIVLAGSTQARAGGGPENVFLVVNSASWASQTVANHYIEMRRISPINVFYIEWRGGFEGVDGETFRKEILVPTMNAISRRGLASQIDYVIYSSDFPYHIDLSRDFPGLKFPDQNRPECSLTSASYLWLLVVAKRPEVVQFDINRYMRNAASRTVDEPTHGFRSWYGWGGHGELSDAGGQPYMLSTMLGMTSGRGNSVNEVLSYLRRSVDADGTHPKGTIYYCKTGDVRSTTRAPMFETAVSELKALGVNAEIVSTKLPVSRDDVMGVMSGVSNFSWAGTRSTILPGAICENLTSFGGVMDERGSHTPISEFLRYGAAGSSGTVVEPFALDVKFPSPLVHVHYARGCSLAESFYQSLHSPMQLLIIGEPLCRPWADIPQVEVGGLPADGKVSGTLSLEPTARVPGGGAIDHFELFADGRRMGTTRLGRGLVWDSTRESDGYHELRVVAVAAGPIETQGHKIIPVTVDNHQHTIRLAVAGSDRIRWGETLKLTVAAPGMSKLVLVHNARVIGSADGPQAEISVDPRVLALGPVFVQAVGTSGAERVWSAPLRVVVEPAVPLPPIANPPANLSRGLVLQLPDGKVMRVDETREPAWLTLKGLRADEPYVLQGFFAVDAEDVYQFQLWHRGAAKLIVDGHTLYSSAQGNGTEQFVPVALAPGLHRLTVSGRTGNDPKLRILFGGAGTESLGRNRFRHAQ